MATGKMGYGRCKGLFWIAIAFDLAGLTLIIVGIFANFQVAGRAFGDFLIYSGGIVVFFSLLLWLAWYSGNLEVSMEELEKEPVYPKQGNLKQLARKFSETFSKRKRRRMNSLSATKKEVAVEVGMGIPAILSLPREPLYGNGTGSMKDNCHQLESPIFFIEEGTFGHLQLNTLNKVDNHVVSVPWPLDDRLE